MENISATFEMLLDKNNTIAYHAMQTLQAESEQSNVVYPYMNQLVDMLEHKNSFVRNRALILIAYNAKWDADNKIDELIDQYLKHITDEKPITARQCIQQLPFIAKHKPDLRKDILQALLSADISKYKDSMQPLIYQDIREAIDRINSY